MIKWAALCLVPMLLVGSTGTAPTTTAVARDCAFDFCPPSIPGPLAAWPLTGGPSYFQLEDTSIRLVDPGGKQRWQVAVDSAQLPDDIASGDFTGDGVPDYIFEETRPASPPKPCNGHPTSVVQLVFIDGATGQAWRPLPATPDVCWTNLGYATHQWGIGTAYIGHFLASRQTNQIVLFPYYASIGWVLTFNRHTGWTYAHGSRPTLAFPSTPAFDQVYDASNPTPCEALAGASACYVQNSHVANAIFLGDGQAAAGLFVLTSDRAFVYRPDFTPTSDLVFAYESGSGRNYGLVESHPAGGGEMVTLVGGCSVAKTRDSMRLHQLSDDPCGLQHHYEYFLVQGQSIVQHSGAFFGWAGDDGLWQNRLEFPFPSVVPLTGDAMWSVFNLYRDGEWRAELLPNPADPGSAIEVPGWYVWGTVYDRLGNAYLAATRTSATAGTSVDSYVPQWQFDLLAFQGGQLGSYAHFDGVVPSLALVPPAPDYHASDGDPFTVLETSVARCGPNEILVENAAGVQSYAPVPDHRTGAC